ncbi:hypothetical protein E2C01_099130 [Portunus trituberculatus]|uniref:Uncharacterized protein n=1 Tax=Portunus trituberculatus TaxID=210409 RepID=A0A5B7K8S7_PORTR|nr:hypothetical protein [Portunus trituberculatus]
MHFENCKTPNKSTSDSQNRPHQSSSVHRKSSQKRPLLNNSPSGEIFDGAPRKPESKGTRIPNTGAGPHKEESEITRLILLNLL